MIQYRKTHCGDNTGRGIVVSPHWGFLYFDELVQERRNSIVDALELRLSCSNPWICNTTAVHWIICPELTVETIHLPPLIGQIYLQRPARRSNRRYTDYGIPLLIIWSALSFNILNYFENKYKSFLLISWYESFYVRLFRLHHQND